MASLAQINVLFKADLEGFSNEMQNATRAIKKAGKEWQSIGKDLSTYVTAPLAAIGGFSSNLAMDFDDSMRKVMATTNASESEFRALRDTAEEMGAKTRYSASQAAEAMNYMALAGWKTQQIIEGIPGMLQLAAASGEDLGLVSDILTDGLTAMGKSASDAGQFVDVLAATASNSNTTVAMLGQAFAYAAPLAGALGFQVEDLTLAIGLMSNAGIKGEKAGTALRSILTRLVKPTKESQRALSELGVSVVNADDSIKPLVEIIGELREKFAHLTKAEAAQKAGMLAGQEALSGFLALVSAAPDDFNTLSNAITNSAGTAKRMSDQMEGGVGGSWREMKSILEGVAIQIGRELEPSFKALINVVKVVGSVFMSMTDGQRKFVVVIGAVVSAIGPMLLAYGTMLKILPAVIGNLRLATTAMYNFSAAILTNPIGITITALGALVAALFLFRKETDASIVSAKAVNDVLAISKKSIAGEKAELYSLLKIAKDETISKDKRQDAIKRLNAISPEYLRTITLETINTKEATEQIDLYVKALERKAKEQAILSKKTELFQKKIDLELKNAKYSGFDQAVFDGIWKLFGITSDVVVRSREELESYIDKLGVTGSAADKIRSLYDPYLKQKEREIKLIDEQVAALDELTKSQENSLPLKVVNPEDPNPNGTGSASGSKLPSKGTVDSYNAQIDALEKLRNAHSTASDSYLELGEQIASIQEKINALTGVREKATAIEMNFIPVVEGSIAALERQKASLESQMSIIRGWGGEFTMQYQALKEKLVDIEVKITANVDEGTFDRSYSAFLEGRQTVSDATNAMLEEQARVQSMMNQAVGDSLLAMGGSIAQGLAQGELSLQQFTGIFIQEIIKIIAASKASTTAQAIEGAVTSTKATGIGALFAMPGFIATALGIVAGAFAGIPKFANGGIVSGPTFGLMGEYVGAANNPEVIAPLNKLKDLIEPANSSGVTQITLGGGFVINGRDLQLVLDRNSTRSKRIG